MQQKPKSLDKVLMKLLACHGGKNAHHVKMTIAMGHLFHKTSDKHTNVAKERTSGLKIPGANPLR